MNKIDQMGKLHNALTDDIVKSKLPPQDVEMVLKLLMNQCEEVFAKRIINNQLRGKNGRNVEKDSVL